MAASKRFSVFARRQRGTTMPEVLVTLLVTSLGLLGLAGLQGQVQRAEFESYQRAQALILLHDMVDRINSNRATVPCFVVTTNSASGAPYLGAGAAAAPACGFGNAADNAVADASIAEWDAMLKGSAENRGGTAVEAMIGARGCVTYDAASEVVNPGTGLPTPGTGVYTVAVSWQGSGDTVVPAANCANTLYGPETRRRTIATTFRIAALD